jgi:hypothetical protein
LSAAELVDSSEALAITADTGTGNIVDDQAEPTVVASGILLTNTNVDNQVLKAWIVETNGVQQTVDFDEPHPRAAQGSEITPVFDEGEPVTFDPDFDYAIIVQYKSGGANVDIREFTLIDEFGNTVFTLLASGGSNDIKLDDGTSQSAYDGAIFIVNGDGAEFAVADPIGYDLLDTDLLNGTDLLVLDSSNAGQHDFTLDLGLLVLENDKEGTPDFDDDPFGDVETIDISGAEDNSEDNTIILNVEDVLDITGDDNILTIIGDAPTSDNDTDGGDTVKLEGTWSEADDLPNSEGFFEFTSTDAGDPVTLLVQSDLNIFIDGTEFSSLVV